MRVAILHGAMPPNPSQDEADAVHQIAAVAQALRQLGHDTTTVPLTLNLAMTATALRRLGPGCVFNLVESVQGRGHDIHLGPALLDALGLSYTGADTVAMVCTSNKLLAKRLLQGAGLPIPPWGSPTLLAGVKPGFDGPYIVKSVWEHASIGLSDDAVTVTPEQLGMALARRAKHAAAPWFFERYIEGREFNVSLLAGPDGVEVLPVAEMEFRDYPAGKARIVGYKAKWEATSFEYQHTTRRFDVSDGDGPLLKHLQALARRCWEVFELQGYARVDLRVDATGQPWILDVNANPCLTPDSGFVAAAFRSGLSYHQIIARILAAAHTAPAGGPPLSPDTNTARETAPCRDRLSNIRG